MKTRIACNERKTTGGGEGKVKWRFCATEVSDEIK